MVSEVFELTCHLYRRPRSNLGKEGLAQRFVILHGSFTGIYTYIYTMVGLDILKIYSNLNNSRIFKYSNVYLHVHVHAY